MQVRKEKQMYIGYMQCNKGCRVQGTGVKDNFQSIDSINLLVSEKKETKIREKVVKTPVVGNNHIFPCPR
jgi:hypothetical protein